MLHCFSNDMLVNDLLNAQHKSLDLKVIAQSWKFDLNRAN